MSNNSAEQYFPRSTRSSTRIVEHSRRRGGRTKKPSGFGYLVTAISATLVLFFAFWWMFVTGGDEAPWIPAGLAASVVLLVALSAREVVMRRAWTKHLLEQGGADRPGPDLNSHSARRVSTTALSSTLRAIQKQSTAADVAGSADTHLDLFHMCRDYSASAEEALQSNNLLAEKRVALRSGLDRAKHLQKHHLLTWARESSRALTAEAQQRARMSDKIEAANKAVQCLDTALEVYPGESELIASRRAVGEYIGSVKVAHWVEMAERAAFKGHYRRAVERYKDALFYLQRETIDEDVRRAGEKKIGDEIEALQERVRMSKKNRNNAVEVERSGGSAENQ